MLHTLKKRLYFIASAYFVFWAKFVLRRWKPRVILITGSSGKTTLLHMAEAQLGEQAIYTHHANSAFGIANILLGLPSNVPSKLAWPRYFLMAPFGIWHKLPTQKFFVVEADCDRPHEGEFIAKFVKPEVVLWASVSNTHSMNFDGLVKAGKFKTHLDAIAYEFANYVRAASRLVIANADYPAIQNQLANIKTGVKVELVSKQSVSAYKLEPKQTLFTIQDQTITLPGLHPKDAGSNVQMMIFLLRYLGLPFDSSFAKLTMPPGRNNLLIGKKNTVLIDSTYNTGLGATLVVLDMFNEYTGQHKWAVIGDILEQGSLEKTEHEQLANELGKIKLEQIVLLGRRNLAYTYPLLQRFGLKVVAYENPKEVLDYLLANLKSGEAILFKGAQGLEGVIEQLLANPADETQLVRREADWVKRRQAWGLPK